MTTVAHILAGIVAVEHFLFLVLEVFLWQTPYGRRTFGITPEFAAETAALMKNQGTYNGFLAAGILFSLVTANYAMTSFLLVCVVVAGLVGGLTVKRSILFVQALPAAAALVASVV